MSEQDDLEKFRYEFYKYLYGGPLVYTPIQSHYWFYNNQNDDDEMEQTYNKQDGGRGPTSGPWGCKHDWVWDGGRKRWCKQCDREQIYNGKEMKWEWK